MSKWTVEVPTEAGQYWFIGYPWATGHSETELYYVSVRKCSNGVLYITGGNFMVNKLGLWSKVELPEFPDGITVKLQHGG